MTSLFWRLLRSSAPVPQATPFWSARLTADAVSKKPWRRSCGELPEKFLVFQERSAMNRICRSKRPKHFFWFRCWMLQAAGSAVSDAGARAWAEMCKLEVGTPNLSLSIPMSHCRTPVPNSIGIASPSSGKETLQIQRLAGESPGCSHARQNSQK